MEKKQYQIPTLTVVALQQQAALMEGSTIEHLNEPVYPNEHDDEVG